MHLQAEVIVHMARSVLLNDEALSTPLRGWPAALHRRLCGFRKIRFRPYSRSAATLRSLEVVQPRLARTVPAVIV